MKCTGCETWMEEGAKFCSNCGTATGSTGANPGIEGGYEFIVPSGFGRTLSTELLIQQEKQHLFDNIQALVECCQYSPGEVIIRKGELSRDLYFLTEGQTEIVSTEDNHDVLLNEVAPPYILGDIGLLLGIPRTATLRAKSHATVYILRYAKFQEIIGTELPGWFSPLLRAFVGGIKSLNSSVTALEQEALLLRQKLAAYET